MKIKNITNTMSLSKEKIENLSKIRIIKKNLVHIHGFPKNLAKTEKLQSNEYLGQYGKIIRAMITYKINPPSNKKVYSAYITFSNEIEAACAILCVDSLLVKGKIIRAFFGTTKYCSYFLNNSVCPNEDKCLFLHNLIDDKDIILDENASFSYNEHLNLSKKIIQFSNPITKELILKMKKPKKSIFPFVDFIFMNEKEKENYFVNGNISYFSYSNNCINDNINNMVLNKCNDKKIISSDNVINFNINNAIFINNSKNCFIFDNINQVQEDSISNTVVNYNSPNSMEPLELQKLLDKSINHILLSRPFFSNIKNIPLRKMELEYLKNVLNKNGKEMKEIFKGCLDKLGDIM